MNLEKIPLAGRVFQAGATDPLFEGLLLLGPVLLFLVLVLGRNSVTVVLTSGYVIVFVGRIVHNFRRSDSESTPAGSETPSRISR